MFPETAGKTLEEVESMFTGKTKGGRKYLGTPPWRTAVESRALYTEPSHEKASNEEHHVDSSDLTTSPPASTDEEHHEEVPTQQLETV